MKTLALRAVRSRFAGDALAALVLSALISVLNFLYFISAGRLLDPRQFGALSALVACLTIGTILANARMVSVTRDIGNTPRTGVLEYWQKWRRKTLRAAPVPVLAALVFLPLLAVMLSVSWRDVMLMYFAQVALVGATVALGILNGLKRIKLVYTLNLLGTCVKLLVALIAFQLGGAVAGGMAAYLAGFFLVLLLANQVLRRDARKPASSPLMPRREGRPREQPHTAPWTSLSYLLLVVPFTLDQVLVQSFAPGHSGAYAAVATLGKIVFFAAWPISSVAYPYLVNTRDERSQLRFFLAGLGGALLIGIPVCLLFLLFSGPAALFAYGTKYSGVAGLVPWYALAALFYVAAVSVQQIPLARGRSFASVPLLAVALVQLVLFSLNHDSLTALVTDQVIVLCAQMVVMSLFFLKRRKRPEPTVPEP